MREVLLTGRKPGGVRHPAPYTCRLARLKTLR